MRQGLRWRYLLPGLLTVGLLAVAGEARAQSGRFWRTQGTKPGPLMFNLKMGGALGAYHFYYGSGGAPHQFVLQLEAGFAVTQDRNGYLIAPIQFQLAPGISTVMLPFGFQYDIPLPVPGLYLTPRISGGYAAWVSGYGYAYYYGHYGTYHTGFIMPEFGAKYVLKGRLNFGAELFSLPVFFSIDGAAVQYRVLIYGGINL